MKLPIVNRAAILAIVLVATSGMMGGCSTEADTRPDKNDAGFFSENNGFNPDDEDYSGEATDLDCADVSGPVEVEPGNDPNNLDRDGDGVACEWN